MVDAPEALRAGVSGLVISFAKQLNKLLGPPPRRVARPLAVPPS
jgi:hypothetical protein